MRIKKLEWSITKGFMSERWYARAMGIEWTIPVSNGTAQDNKRVEAEKEKAQSEFERDLKRWIEDPDSSAPPASEMRTDTTIVYQRYKAAWEAVFGSLSFLTVMDIADGKAPVPQPLPNVMKEMGVTPNGLPPIIHQDKFGNTIPIWPSAKNKVVDHLIQEHAEISKQHTKAIHAGQHGISPGLRERLKSIETSLAIAVKDADISPANEQKESGK